MDLFLDFMICLVAAPVFIYLANCLYEEIKACFHHPEREARGMALLKENLTPEQLACYEKHKHFYVRGSSGTWYRIHHGRYGNVTELDSRMRDKYDICFYPKGHLVLGDVLLGQKLALELRENDALRIANTVAEHVHAPEPTFFHNEWRYVGVIEFTACAGGGGGGANYTVGTGGGNVIQATNNSAST